jgi:hypothetical protein
MVGRSFVTVVVSAVLATMAVSGEALAQSDVVLYASEASAARGHWASAANSSAAGGRSMKSADQGFSSTNAPQASPANYFESTFEASAGVTYRVWLRLRAENNSKWNDAVWVQFDKSTTAAGSVAYRIGTTSGLMVNLERCAGCGLSNWGWYNTAYWLAQETSVRFATSGTQTLRIQTREDGVEIDQIVLSPATYASNAPGPMLNDATILAKTSTTTSPPVIGRRRHAFAIQGLAIRAPRDGRRRGLRQWRPERRLLRRQHGELRQRLPLDRRGHSGRVDRRPQYRMDGRG